jgi:multidrug efflux pump subunit AcrB
VKIQGVDFSLTCTMGIISLMGILVRNGIIMVDYAEELRKEEKMCVRDAIYHSAKRRMRPIFLTSAAASMGVIPMIIGGSGLWMPMGTVIFYGTLITMFFILTIIPVAYWKVMAGSTKKRAMKERMERE